MDKSLVHLPRPILPILPPYGIPFVPQRPQTGPAPLQIPIHAINLGQPVNGMTTPDLVAHEIRSASADESLAINLEIRERDSRPFRHALEVIPRTRILRRPRDAVLGVVDLALDNVLVDHKIAGREHVLAISAAL